MPEAERQCKYPLPETRGRSSVALHSRTNEVQEPPARDCASQKYPAARGRNQPLTRATQRDLGDTSQVGWRVFPSLPAACPRKKSVSGKSAAPSSAAVVPCTWASYWPPLGAHRPRRFPGSGHSPSPIPPPSPSPGSHACRPGKARPLPSSFSFAHTLPWLLFPVLPAPSEHDPSIISITKPDSAPSHLCCTTTHKGECRMHPAPYVGINVDVG